MAAVSLTEEAVTEYFPVAGMTCRACARRVAAALSGIPGVYTVQVDLATGRATVRHDPQQNPVAVLQRAVAATGYTLYAPVSSVRVPVWLRPLIAGLLAAGALLALYLGIIILAQDWGHALDQLNADGPFVGALTLGFGTQVGLWVYLRSRHARTPATGVAASTGTSGVAMLACCAHHLAEVLPIVGLSGAALFLAEVKLPLLWLGLSLNLAGILYLLRQIRSRMDCTTPVVLENYYEQA
jgi:copper chaperone CopZ